MNLEKLIAINELCKLYNVEISFFHSLNESGLIEILTLDEVHYLHQDKIYDVEKIIRIHLDLEINVEGIDVIINLLKKIDELQDELDSVKNRLSIYEH
ncbi:MAG: chaperone modulator CbpM [Bacteroidota bacterium]